MRGIHRKVLGVSAALVLVAPGAMATAQPASAVSNSCRGYNTSSSSSHKVTELAADPCFQIQAKAERYFSSGAHQTVLGTIGSASSTVTKGTGTAVTNWGGRAQPVSIVISWSPWSTFTANNQTKTFTAPA